MTTTPSAHNSVRLDVWLWSVRLYKTRSAATTACRAGHVRLNDTSAKAAATVRVGDGLRVRQHGIDRLLTVTGIVTKRVGAPIATTCYDDHTPERPKELVPQIPVRDRGTGRPTKKDRRQMERLRRTAGR